MFFHTLAATLIVAGLAGGWQFYAAAGQDWSVPGHHQGWRGGDHDD